MSDCCPLCQSVLQYRVGRGLELRRFPRGRSVCPHDLKGWHLKLEAMQREIDLCRDRASAAHLRAEFEDMLVQHMDDATHQHMDDATRQHMADPIHLEPVETA